jgi:drug/metabolite transporter (DMT)-like permease
VPVIAAGGAAAFLNEAPNPRLVIAGIAVLGGIGLALVGRARRPI